MPLPQENVDWICGATDEVELQAPGLPAIGPLQRNIFIDENSPFSFVRLDAHLLACEFTGVRNFGVVIAPLGSLRARYLESIFAFFFLMPV